MPPEVPSVLEKIVAHKREEVAAGKAARPRIDVDGLPPTRDFAAAIRRKGITTERGGAEGAQWGAGPRGRHGDTTEEGKRRGGEEGMGAISTHASSPLLLFPSSSSSVSPCLRDDSIPRDAVRLIAEVKHASPVKGVLRADFDPIDLARTYTENGAAALSVLTDERFFQGHPDYLRQIREVVPVPLLRKEFIIDEWQLAESRVLGADAVLLIVAILSPNQLRDYLHAAEALGMAVLVEVHTEAELEVALASGAQIIGVNNRDLNTFVTDLATTEGFAPRVKGEGRQQWTDEKTTDRPLNPQPSTLNEPERILVSESGISTAADVARVAAFGADAVLVGEALVRERDVAAKVRELSGWILD